MTTNDASSSQSWKTSLKGLLHPRVVTMLFLGFSAGLPILLIFSSLSLWLREAGVERAAVTLFSWAALGYSFKFVWAPLVDQLEIPGLTRRMGRRRAWLVVAQIAVIASILAMANIDPGAGEQALIAMAFAAVMLGFSSATQDIVIDAYRIESAPADLQALMSSTYIAGYRIGMLFAGAGALYLAQTLGSTSTQYVHSAWQLTYALMASGMLVGVVTTLVIPEPAHPVAHDDARLVNARYGQFLLLFVLAVAGFVGAYVASAPIAVNAKQMLRELFANAALASVVVETTRLIAGIAVAGTVGMVLVALRLVDRKLVVVTYLNPVKEFFERQGFALACLLLAIIGLYRISDIVLGVVSNVFYQDLGFTKTEIAAAVKTFGLFMTIAGGFLGGLLSIRYGVRRILLLGAILAAATNLLFMLLAETGYNVTLLYVVVAADNLCAGLASAAFVAFLSSLTNISFTAMQYALFSSIMTLIPKVLGGYSGGIVDTLGYSGFFAMTALAGVPVIVLIVIILRRVSVEDSRPT